MKSIILEHVIGSRIRNIRESLNLSRPDFGALIGIPATTVKNYELHYRTSLPASLLQQVANRYPNNIGDYPDAISAVYYLLTGNDPKEYKWNAPSEERFEGSISDRLKLVRGYVRFNNRPSYAKALGFRPTTYKNYELGYRGCSAEVILGLFHRFGLCIAMFVLTGMWEPKSALTLKDIPDGKKLWDGNLVTVADYNQLSK